MKWIIGSFLCFVTLFVSLAEAQDSSYVIYKNNDEPYQIPLKILLADAEKELGITIQCDVKVEPYLDRTVKIAPWKYWNDPELRLAYFLAPLDLSFEKIDEKTFRVFEPWYYIRPQNEAKAHLERLAAMYPDRESWTQRRAELRETILQTMDLSPLPKRNPLNPIYSEPRQYEGYSVENVALEVLPGYFVSGTLYRPTEQEGPFPIVLCPHGHGKEGRFQDVAQIRAATLARMGAIAMTYSMFAWIEEESPLLLTDHRVPFAGTMQTWTTMRVLDFLTSLDQVDAERIGITGESGGGTQTFLATALDDRIKVAVPTVMVSAHFYGGCPCESGLPFHILCGGTCNAEIAAMAAPRPLHLTAVKQDWTCNTPDVEFPYIQNIYGFYDAKENVEYAIFDEPHDYGESKRQAMYPFMAKHLGLDLSRVDESKVVIEPREQMLLFGTNGENYPEDGIQNIDELREVFKAQKP
ncbi:MAG: acetylxylan esterase [Planctomycetia bacterium]|nr:acetylxylan esterase [Planctomycetia bacterium]